MKLMPRAVFWRRVNFGQPNVHNLRRDEAISSLHGNHFMVPAMTKSLIGHGTTGSL
jgi:hypothetical protein